MISHKCHIYSKIPMIYLVNSKTVIQQPISALLPMLFLTVIPLVCLWDISQKLSSDWNYFWIIHWIMCSFWPKNRNGINNKLLCLILLEIYGWLKLSLKVYTNTKILKILTKPSIIMIQITIQPSLLSAIIYQFVKCLEIQYKELDYDCTRLIVSLFFHHRLNRNWSLLVRRLVISNLIGIK